MKSLPFLLLAGLLALTGCSTIHSRIEERSGVFASLDPATQEKIKKGEVDLGFTPDMVYIALGDPDERHEKLQPEGVKMTWVYKTYYDEYQGTAVAFRRRLVYVPAAHAYVLITEPVTADVYAPASAPKMKVEFINGKVSAIEESKDGS